ncbi:MAG: hypothetical protein BJ554DRAFT_8072 [Olpidium bornovanus]|uniref:Uncharacterized protein n=1 Tax=Olpidium bornovanus TaxID=278681 RepID=A0A8H7ZVJ2_9FUNG|nr:MAG: hypothetical protein BJ554DRAFT_8072 [Olpidium bornovanus]
MQSSSEMKAIRLAGVTSMQSFPARVRKPFPHAVAHIVRHQDTVGNKCRTRRVVPAKMENGRLLCQFFQVTFHFRVQPASWFSENRRPTAQMRHVHGLKEPLQQDPCCAPIRTTGHDFLHSWRPGFIDPFSEARERQKSKAQRARNLSVSAATGQAVLRSGKSRSRRFPPAVLSSSPFGRTFLRLALVRGHDGNSGELVGHGWCCVTESRQSSCNLLAPPGLVVRPWPAGVRCGADEGLPGAAAGCCLGRAGTCFRARLSPRGREVGAKLCEFALSPSPEQQQQQENRRLPPRSAPSLWEENPPAHGLKAVVSVYTSTSPTGNKHKINKQRTTGYEPNPDLTAKPGPDGEADLTAKTSRAASPPLRRAPSAARPPPRAPPHRRCAPAAAAIAALRRAATAAAAPSPRTHRSAPIVARPPPRTHRRAVTAIAAAIARPPPPRNRRRLLRLCQPPRAHRRRVTALRHLRRHPDILPKWNVLYKYPPRPTLRRKIALRLFYRRNEHDDGMTASTRSKASLRHLHEQMEQPQVDARVASDTESGSELDVAKRLEKVGINPRTTHGARVFSGNYPTIPKEETEEDSQVGQQRNAGSASADGYPSRSKAVLHGPRSDSKSTRVTTGHIFVVASWRDIV